MKNLKKEFPVTAQYTHLNTAGCGLMSETLLDWRHDHDLDYLIMGSKLKDKQETFIKKLRAKIGQFFNADPEKLALVPNFSFGINIYLDSLKRDTKFLLLSNDYPSINWPVEERKFEICYAEINEHLEQNILKKVEEEKPDILALSLVQYLNGVMIDLDFLKTLKAKFPQLLIIADGTQFLGTQEFDFQNSGIDVLGASCYKWMNAGYGNGLFLFKETTAQQLPETLGYGSVRGRGDDKQNFIGRFEPGHLDTLTMGSIGAAIDLIKKVGFENIENHIKLLSDKAMQAFAKRDLLEDYIPKRKQHSSIFNIKGDEKLYNKLKEHDIITTPRGSGIRVSFHYFNTEKDLDKLLKVI